MDCNKGIRILLVVAIAGWILVGSALAYLVMVGVVTPIDDARIRIDVNEVERALILRDMNIALAARRDILNSLAEGSTEHFLDTIGAINRHPGRKFVLSRNLARKGLRLKLPPQFSELAAKVHEAYLDMETAARNGRTNLEILKIVSAQTAYCLVCHNRYRLRYVD